MTVPLTARVLIADDHPIVRDGVRRVLEARPDFTVVAEAADGATAADLAVAEQVDLAVLDVAMPGTSGLQAARALAARSPSTRTLMLSMYDDEEYLFDALAAGASGYVLKTSVDRDLVEACRAVLRGEPFLYPSAVRAIVREHLERARRGERVRVDPLTPREREIVALIAQARTNDEIASALGISAKTVGRHRANILDKLGVHDRVQLTRYAVRRRLVEP
ncbi:response regulator transcription factor [Conexibacter sp. JD483]|uniref:response regulator n=1 Tax=unclassified Conexibacter TaxID=2627773 RepID=UPI00271F32D9|nr:MULTISPECIES: response regulator transcription factor [unclassified Conexibacter]MDO8188638.1 response regulator transcription factor [Conexibacter sp. CPCC 205706]MDO8201526.1 response regulator transcription factor [Conexibacter sp. CPCC 205762]MDR9370745.1 response regulator transcription factor [Conexibacter sp. JD483]